MVDSYIYTSRKLRIIVVYRRPYSEKRKVFIGIFVNEFSDLHVPDSIILSKDSCLSWVISIFMWTFQMTQMLLKLLLLLCMSLLGP